MRALLILFAFAVLAVAQQFLVEPRPGALDDRHEVWNCRHAPIPGLTGWRQNPRSGRQRRGRGHRGECDARSNSTLRERHGGDLFAIYYEAKTGKLYALNSSGWTPKGLTIEYLKGKGIDKLDPIGVNTITVPGCVAGWEALRGRFGTLPFSKLLAPAIFYAENGFTMPEWGARSWISKSFLKQPGYQETYMPGGVRPGLGDVFKNPALGESLRQGRRAWP